MPEKLIVDNDWGGDAFQVMALLSGFRDRFEVLGASSVFGNAPLEFTTENMLRILSFVGWGDIPCFAGAAHPIGAEMGSGDGAHGADGIGGVVLPRPKRQVESREAADFILDSLRQNPAKTVTLLATAPLTNLALALRRDPDAMRRAKQIIIMGGCLQAMPAVDVPQRSGNIVPHAEFNFYMAPADAQAIVQSGISIVLFPMNCTHQLTFTLDRRRKLRDAIHDAERTALIEAMLSVPADIDRRKFGIDAVMHDIHTALYLIRPDLYEGSRGRVSVATCGGELGRSVFVSDDNGPVLAMERLKDPEAAYDLFLDSLRR
jgi:purine nucleosidase